MKYLASIASILLLPVLALAELSDVNGVPEPNSDEVMLKDTILDWQNPFKRSPHPLVKRDNDARNIQAQGDNAMVVYMCRDTAQQDCDAVWVSTSQYCFDNAHWFGWTSTATYPKSIKIQGTTCCAFYADKACAKPNNYMGWLTKVCEGDTGDAAIISGVPQSYMCNVPYGSAGTNMQDYPSDVAPLPSTAANVVAPTVAAKAAQ